MNIHQKVGLKDFSTMRLGGKAEYLCEITNKDDLIDAIAWADEHKLPIIMIGGGSNIIWRDTGFKGLVLVNKMHGFETSDDTQEEIIVTIGAGEEWDSVVKRVTELGYSGIECLSLIPGTAGATPIQNVGAYGQEISTSLLSVEAYDREVESFVLIPAVDCGFSYRSSRFKAKDKSRFFITGIILKLTRSIPNVPFYASVQQYLDVNQITTPSPQIIRDAVIAIRQSKLPDPKIVPNTGSFFTNPMISIENLKNLQKKNPAIPYWQTDTEQVKLSAAWLIEQAGFKAVNDPETGISTWPSQPLVLVNTSAKDTADLMHFKQKLVDKVKTRFGVELIQEPELLP